MRSKLIRRLAGMLAVAGLTGWAATDAPAKGPLPDATYPKVVQADIDHLKYLAESVATKKTYLNRMKMTALMLATYAQESDQAAGVRAGAIKVADAAKKKDAAGAAAAAKELAGAKGGGAAGGKAMSVAEMVKAYALDADPVMHVMAAKSGGGMNTEKDLQAWAKKGVTDPAAVEVQAARTAVLADFTLVTPPEFGGKKKKEDWDKWSKEMKTLAVEVVAEAAKGDKADKAKLKKLLVGLDRNCVACHDVFRDE